MPTIERLLSQPQYDLVTATERYVDGEGAIRSGKSTTAAEKLCTLVTQYPGIPCLVSRWSEEDMEAQVKPLWREMAALYGLELKWNATEHYDEVVGYGSKVYLRGLKAGEQTSRYAKFRGLTLAFIWVDQAEEIPADVYQELKGRLSAPGYPHQLLITPNPPGDDHWIAKEFPDDKPKEHYRYIRFHLDDNAPNLGPETVTAIKEAYPEGSAMRRRLVEGRRGLASVGEPVYRGYFARSLHVQPVEMDPECPLLEGWDFGHSHPAVVWEQRLPWGELRILGGVMAEDMFLPEFAQVALQYRSRWFPNPLEVWRTNDPAGETRSNQGIDKRAVDVLKDVEDIGFAPVAGANHPERRNAAIQATASYMRRRTSRGEAFTCSERFAFLSRSGVKTTPVLADGFEAGYVWDSRSLANSTSPNTRRPKKDGFYDHTQNCHEYIELAFGQAQPTQKSEAVLVKKHLRQMQQDTDYMDPARGSRFLPPTRRQVSLTRNRSGY